MATDILTATTPEEFATPISPETIEQLHHILNDIACKSITLKNLSIQAMYKDRRDAGAILDAMESVASQIGYAANMAIKKIGNDTVEEAEYFFLPPACRKKEQEATA